jgi:hypothetical protein
MRYGDGGRGGRRSRMAAEVMLTGADADKEGKQLVPGLPED